MTPRHGTLSIVLTAVIATLSVTARAANPVVTFSTINTNVYFGGDTNSCAIALNNLTTIGNYEFATFYSNNNNAHRLMVARRVLGSSVWTAVNSGFTISNSEISDDHNVIALAVDANGLMHLSWNMHNNPLNYAISNVSVLGSTFAPTFTQQTSANAPTLFPDGGSTANEVTYPQFYNIPNSNNLLFTYRNGGAGGGSGNGNQYFNIYNPNTNTWSQTFVINGEQTSVNAYLNRLVYTSTNNLLMSWTWRATPNWQTNSNIMFAQSPDNGITWAQQGGAPAYALPIIQNTSAGGDPNAVGQVVVNIPQGSSFINQTSMTVDALNRPMVSSYMAPNWNVASSSGDPNRQYMLWYYTGSHWAISQITNRTSDTAIDSSGNNVRDLGRPIVVVDKQNRILVITRSEDTAMGSWSNPSTPNNIVVYYTTDSMAAASGSDIPDVLHWQSITLDSANMGNWEPTYDSTRWAHDGVLDLFYEPTGLTGQTFSSVQVLEWDEQAYFANIPEPASLAMMAAIIPMLLRRRK
jgi:hypothetical protein